MTPCSSHAAAVAVKRGGDRRRPRLRWAAFSSTPSPTAPDRGDGGPRAGARPRGSTTSPRASRRRIVARSDPAALARSARRCRARRERPQHRPLAQAERASPSASAPRPVLGRAPPRARSAGARAGPRAPVPVPGGSASPRPRAGVEQYSSPTQRPSSTSSGGTPASSASSGSASRRREPRWSRRARRRPPSPAGARRAPPGSTRPPPRPSTRAADSRTAPGRSGWSAAARPWRSPWLQARRDRGRARARQ